MESIFTKTIQYFTCSILCKNIVILQRFLSLPFIYLIRCIYFSYSIILPKTKAKKTNSRAYYIQKKKWLFFKNNLKFFIVLFEVNGYVLDNKKVFNSIKLNNSNLRLNTRVTQTNWAFYKKFTINSAVDKKEYLRSFWVHYLTGIFFIWKALRYWLLGLLVGSFTFYYLTYIKLLPFSKMVFEWIILTMFYYWLISGFTYFIKRYQYSKFTSAMQRFWKRSYAYFWVLEGIVFSIFFFIVINSPEEPFYMYDTIKNFKTHLFSWRLFLLKIIPIISMIILGYYLLLSLKWATFSKQVTLLVAITLLLVYTFWLEFYQFFHIINFYGSPVWLYDSDEFIWTLEIDFKRTRIVNNVTTICLLAKFWHLVFIFLFWIFFILRVNEIGRVRFPLLAANLQNFIILYVLSWLYMFPWLKFLFRRHLEVEYFWYFYNARRIGVRVFFNDFYLFLLANFQNIGFRLGDITSFKTGAFYYWLEASSEFGHLQYKKFIIRDYIIELLNS